MLRGLRNLWKNYKYRFVPWISLNIIREERKRILKQTETGINKNAGVFEKDHYNIKESIRQLQNLEIDYVKKDDVLITNKELKNTLAEFFEKLSYPRNSNYTKYDIHKKNCSIFYDHFGFLVGRRKSTIAPEGLGVFVVEGTAMAGSLVGLYPGTVYMPYEPLFFPSLGNSFIFRCSDGVHVDGNDRWLSKSIYKSCASRDRFHFDVPCCDTTWLTDYPENTLNIGQYVNNQSRNHNNNVVYQECRLFLTDTKQLMPKHISEEECFPTKLARFIPNVWSNPVNNMQYSLRIIPLVAVDDIVTGSELLSSYFTVIRDS